MKELFKHSRELRCRLEMMGISLEVPSYTHGDTKNALFSTSTPESTLKKNTQTLAYHLFAEGVARYEWTTV